MVTFRKGMSVRVLDSVDEVGGETGRVSDLHHLHPDWAWIEMDRSLPLMLRTFGLSDPRRNWMLFTPVECEEIDEYSGESIRTEEHKHPC